MLFILVLRFFLGLTLQAGDFFSLSFDLSALRVDLLLLGILAILDFLKLIADQGSRAGSERAANCRAGSRAANRRADYCASGGSQSAADQGAFLPSTERLGTAAEQDE
jgi:hypothetical protein